MAAPLPRWSWCLLKFAGWPVGLLILTDGGQAQIMVTQRWSDVDLIAEVSSRMEAAERARKELHELTGRWHEQGPLYQKLLDIPHVHIGPQASVDIGPPTTPIFEALFRRVIGR